MFLYKLKRIILVIFLVFPLCGSAEYVLPTEMLAPHTVMIMRVDLNKFTEAKMMELVRYLVDEAALSRYGLEIDYAKDVEPTWKQSTTIPQIKALKAAGADYLYVVGMVPPPETGATPQVYVLAPLTNESLRPQLEAVLRATVPLVAAQGAAYMGDMSQRMGGEISLMEQFVDDNRIDSWLVVHSGPLPTVWSPAKEKRFAEGLTLIKRHAIGFVLVPNFVIRDPAVEKMIGQLPEVNPKADWLEKVEQAALYTAGAEAAKILGNAHWYAGYADFGASGRMVVAGRLSSDTDAMLVKLGYDQLFPNQLIPAAKAEDQKALEEARKKGKEVKPPSSLEMAQHVIKSLEMKQSGKMIGIVLTADEMRDTMTYVYVVMARLAEAIAEAIVPFGGEDSSSPEGE